MKKIAFGCGALLVTAILTANVKANTSQTWSQPTVVFGQNVDSVQKTQLLEDFGLSANDPYKEVIATSADMAKYLSVNTGVPMYSSVKVEKLPQGSNISVKIADTSLITSVTAEQYTNAAITAGATDVAIVVSAPFEVTGESALSGVYKALETNGQKLDTERTQVAQQEIQTVTEIVKENAQTSNFDPKSLDAAIAEIKVNLSEYKKNQGGLANDETVNDIVNAGLKAYGLDGIVTAEQVAELVRLAQAYQNTSAIDSTEVIQQLEGLQTQLDNVQNKVTESAGKLLESAKEQGVLEKGKAFFNSLFNSVLNVFK